MPWVNFNNIKNPLLATTTAVALGALANPANAASLKLGPSEISNDLNNAPVKQELVSPEKLNELPAVTSLESIESDIKNEKNANKNRSIQEQLLAVPEITITNDPFQNLLNKTDEFLPNNINFNLGGDENIEIDPISLIKEEESLTPLFQNFPLPNVENLEEPETRTLPALELFPENNNKESETNRNNFPKSSFTSPPPSRPLTNFKESFPAKNQGGKLRIGGNSDLPQFPINTGVDGGVGYGGTSGRGKLGPTGIPNGLGNGDINQYKFNPDTGYKDSVGN
ncbi:MAG: hypothetical protein MK033_12910 [Candidatus Caenarcaniphilales bacterium]|nr:hypothetical protein [Candidatus Caenarcaniphilales bacterium]